MDLFFSVKPRILDQYTRCVRLRAGKFVDHDTWKTTRRSTWEKVNRSVRNQVNRFVLDQVEDEVKEHNAQVS